MKYNLRSLMTFSIRDLFWFTVVVALAVGWWVDGSGLQSTRDSFERDAHDLGKYSDPFGGGLPNERFKELRRKYYPVEGKPQKAVDLLPYFLSPAPNLPKPRPMKYSLRSL